MTRILAVVRREWWINTRAYRLSFFGGTLLAAVFTILMGRVLLHAMFNGRVTEDFVARTGTADYMTWLTLGVLSSAFTSRMLYPVRNVLEESQMGTLPALRLTGLRFASFQAGCVGFAAAYALAEAVVILLVVAPWAGASLSGASAPGLLLTFVTGAVGLFGLSTLLSAVVLTVGDRLVVESVAFTLQALVAGVAFPTETLPLPFRIVAEGLPLTWIVRMLRHCVLGTGPAPLTCALALLIIGAAHGLLGLALLRPVVRRALETTP